MGTAKGLRFAALTLLLLAVSLLGACTKEQEKPAEKVVVVEEPVSEIEGPPVKLTEVDVRTDKASYAPGEDIVIEISLKNVSLEAFQMDPFPADLRIVRPIRRTYEDSVRQFPAGTETRSLGPGEAVTYEVTWDQRDDQEQQVPYGYYDLELGHVSLGELSWKLNLEEHPRLLILPAEGSMEKTIEINESQAVGDITITLERVELTAVSAGFFAFNVPPGYTSPKDSGLAPIAIPPGYPSPEDRDVYPHPEPWMGKLHADAEYCHDGGPMKDAGSSGINFLENGMTHSWAELNPVPRGTKELTFVITRLGDWEGPWTFQVPLE